MFESSEQTGTSKAFRQYLEQMGLEVISMTSNSHSEMAVVKGQVNPERFTQTRPAGTGNDYGRTMWVRLSFEDWHNPLITAGLLNY